MRPLCGAIITAGALIGLGLFTMGYGTRYASYYERSDDGKHFNDAYWVKFHQMDTTLIALIVVLLAVLAIGLAITFVGLAYHHHKRFMELTHLHGPKDHSQGIMGPRTGV